MIVLRRDIHVGASRSSPPDEEGQPGSTTNASPGRRAGRQRGFALLVVIVTIALLGAVVGEFGYNANLERLSAANARDQLRAEYRARSGINLVRLLIKIQSSVVDRLPPPMNQHQVLDLASSLLGAFPGVEIKHSIEDGKININCGGGFPTPIPVLADGLFQHYNKPGESASQRPKTPMTPWETQIELPNINCEKCSLQVIQFMADHVYNQPGGYAYHQCADLQITADAAKPIDTRWPGQATSK